MRIGRSEAKTRRAEVPSGPTPSQPRPARGNSKRQKENQEQKHTSPERKESPASGSAQLPPHVDSRGDPDDETMTHEVHDSSPGVFEKRGVLVAPARVHSGQKMVPPEPAVLHDEAFLVNKVFRLGRFPECVDVNIDLPLVRPIGAEGPIESRVLEDARADLVEIGVFGNLEVIRTFRPKVPHRHFSVPLVEVRGMAERHGTDPVHEKPGEEKERQVKVDPANYKIECHLTLLIS